MTRPLGVAIATLNRHNPDRRSSRPQCSRLPWDLFERDYGRTSKHGQETGLNVVLLQDLDLELGLHLYALGDAQFNFTRISFLLSGAAGGGVDLGFNPLV